MIGVNPVVLAVSVSTLQGIDTCCNVVVVSIRSLTARFAWKCHWNIFCITGTLWGETNIHQRIVLTQGKWHESFDVYVDVCLNKGLNKAVKLLLTWWYAMVLMLYHCNEIQTHSCQNYLWVTQLYVKGFYGIFEKLVRFNFYIQQISQFSRRKHFCWYTYCFDDSRF